MNTAHNLAEKSRTAKMTAALVEDASGKWNRELCSYVFPDGSCGAFTKHAVELSGRFSHYQFEEIK